VRFQFVQRAEQHERFAPGCFDSQIGKFVPVNVEGAPHGRGRLVAAEIADDGQSVELTVDTMPPLGDLGLPADLDGLFRFGDGSGGRPAPEGFDPDRWTRT
jgi:hypothetical protein